MDVLATKRRSLEQLPNRSFREPAFARASVLFCDAVADELVRAADAARPCWVKLAEQHPDQLRALEAPLVHESGDVTRLSLVKDFMVAWIEAMGWRISRTYRDAVIFEVPETFLRPLRSSSSLGNLEFVIAALRAWCSGQLRSDDSHCNYQLALNAPAWIPLGVVPQFRDSFAQQLRMVIHHEAGHFRWRGGCLRAEHIAHARGVAAAFGKAAPRDAAELAAQLQTFCPEVWKNEEVRSLVTETKGGARLIRAWSLRSQSIGSYAPR